MWINSPEGDHSPLQARFRRTAHMRTVGADRMRKAGTLWASKCDCNNNYSGWIPSDASGGLPDAQSQSPQEFWRAHVAQRCPAVIQEPLTDLRATLRWTDDYLVCHAVSLQGYHRVVA